MDELIGALNARFKQATDAEWASDDPTDEEWRQFTAQGLATELADACQDIYTLDDGEPLHEPG